METPENPFKAALLEGRKQIGLWFCLSDPTCAEICAGAGFDWMMIDSEHSPNDPRAIQTQLQAVAAYPTHAVVRPPVGDAIVIKQLLDIGAQTLLIPMVESAEQAQMLVQAMRYPPHGIRGIGGARAARWGRAAQYLAEADREVCLLVQVETRKGLENLEAIAAVEGIDGMFVGPADLSASVGHLGNWKHPEAMSAIEDAIKRIVAAGKPAGILSLEESAAQRFLDLGCTFVAVGVDTYLLAHAADSLARRFEEAVLMRVALLLLLATITLSAQTAPIPVKVVVVAMFERGADTGDEPGEYQYWVERAHLDRIFPFPQGYHDLRMNRDGVLGILTGVGTARAAASIMALGLDPRFDLRNAYWIVAGIAGVDPLDASLGSAAWATWIVDGDLAHEIDAREIPPDWKTGIIPLRKSVPYEQPHTDGGWGEAYHLNEPLVDWAFQLTKNVELTDTKEMRDERMQFPYPNARRPPFVLKGDQLSASTFWHGKLMSEWANDWVRYHTDGKGNYVTTAMEDTGTLQSLTFLARAGRVDVKRVLVLRTASDFDQQRPGMTAAESLAGNKLGKYTAYLPALEAAYRVGHVVVDELVKNWTVYRDAMPGVTGSPRTPDSQAFRPQSPPR